MMRPWVFLEATLKKKWSQNGSILEPFHPGAVLENGSTLLITKERMKSTVNFYSAGLQELLAEGIMHVTPTPKVYI